MANDKDKEVSVNSIFEDLQRLFNGSRVPNVKDPDFQQRMKEAAQKLRDRDKPKELKVLRFKCQFCKEQNMEEIDQYGILVVPCVHCGKRQRVRAVEPKE
jgi:hypothetical protein